MNPSTSQPTRWSTIRGAGGQPPSVRRAALEQLCAQYWFPLFAHQRRRGRSTANAAATVEGLLTRLVNDGRGLAELERGPDRFREWLFAYLKERERDLWGGDQVASPTSEHAPIPVHGDEGERRLNTQLAFHPDPLVTYEQAWASETLRMTRDLLSEEMIRAGQQRSCELLLPMLDADAPRDRAAAAAELRKSDLILRVTLSRLRGRFQELLLGVVAESLMDRAEAGHELTFLSQILADNPTKRAPITDRSDANRT